MTNWRTIARVIIETIGEFAIIFAAISLERILTSNESPKWKKVICVFILLLIGTLFRIYGDKITIALNEKNLWEILSRWN